MAFFEPPDLFDDDRAVPARFVVLPPLLFVLPPLRFVVPAFLVVDRFEEVLFDAVFLRVLEPADRLEDLVLPVAFLVPVFDFEFDDLAFDLLELFALPADFLVALEPLLAFAPDEARCLAVRLRPVCFR